jgi:protein O-mannosyl-transferase
MVTSPLARWRRWGGAVFLGSVVMGVFLQVLGFDFLRWDDDINVTQNAALQEPWSWELAGHFFDPQLAMRFKPLHWAMLRVTAGLGGLNPLLWHAFGLALHITAAVWLLAVFRRVLRLVRGGKEATISDECLAWLGAAIWALHPLRVEPVAWVTGSPYPMAGALLVGSFWAYLKAYERGVRRGWLVLSWVLAVAAYATYPVSVTYGLWLMAADRVILRITPVNLWRWSEHGVRRWALRCGRVFGRREFSMPLRLSPMSAGVSDSWQRGQPWRYSRRS